MHDDACYSRPQQQQDRRRQQQRQRQQSERKSRARASANLRRTRANNRTSANKKEVARLLRKRQQLRFFRAPSWASVSYTYVLWRDLRACQFYFCPIYFIFNMVCS